MGLRRPLFVVLFAVLACSVLLLSGQQQPSTAGPFTAEQATAGRTAFQANCAGCHGADLMGFPPLAGAAFMGGWSTRTTRDLFGLIQTTMPTDRPGALSADTYVNIVAFILQSNGRSPGTQPLTATASALIGSPAQAQAPAQAPAAAPQQPAAAAPAGRGAGAAGGAGAGAAAGGGQGGGRGQAQAPLVGLTVAGEVKDFARVTDEMLRNPPPGD